MENLVDYLRSEATTDSVAFTEFVLKYKKNVDTLYCFFEGYEDRAYYPIRIKNISSCNRVIDIVCGGKSDVLKVYQLIRNNVHYKNIKAGFFVDKDFDPNDQLEGIYVTPTYSIENFYLDHQAIEGVLMTEFKISNIDADYNICINLYNNLLTKFNSQIVLINAWLSCQADYRNENKLTTRLNIDKKTKSLFDKVVKADMTDVNKIAIIDSQEEIEKLFYDSPTIDVDVVCQRVVEFENIEHVKHFRGKFYIRFLESFLLRLQSISGADNSPFRKKYSCSLRFESTTICSLLSQYAVTPNCLKRYIIEVSQED
jgi:hypothetical protein